MRRFTVPEKIFLKNFALRQFNFQRPVKIKQEDCDIHSITPKEEYELGYEVISLNRPRTFRLRMFLNLGPKDSLSPFQLELLPPFQEGSLLDEVFSATGTIDVGHHQYEGYPFRPLRLESTRLGFLMTTGCDIVGLTKAGGILLA